MTGPTVRTSMRTASGSFAIARRTTSSISGQIGGRIGLVDRDVLRLHERGKSDVVELLRRVQRDQAALSSRDVRERGPVRRKNGPHMIVLCEATDLAAAHAGGDAPVHL